MIQAAAPTPEMKGLMEDLKSALAKHPLLSGMEMLAIVSQLTGNLVALQDCRRYTTEMVMEVVGKNLEVGNARAMEAVAGLLED